MKGPPYSDRLRMSTPSAARAAPPLRFPPPLWRRSRTRTPGHLPPAPAAGRPRAACSTVPGKTRIGTRRRAHGGRGRWPRGMRRAVAALALTDARRRPPATSTDRPGAHWLAYDLECICSASYIPAWSGRSSFMRSSTRSSSGSPRKSRTNCWRMPSCSRSSGRRWVGPGWTRSRARATPT